MASNFGTFPAEAKQNYLTTEKGTKEYRKCTHVQLQLLTSPGPRNRVCQRNYHQISQKS